MKAIWQTNTNFVTNSAVIFASICMSYCLIHIAHTSYQIMENKGADD